MEHRQADDTADTGHAAGDSPLVRWAAAMAMRAVAPRGGEAARRAPLHDRVGGVPLHALICRSPLFSALPPDEARHIARHARKWQYDAGEYIVRRGHAADALYLLLSGSASTVVGLDEQREVIVDFVDPGDHVGELALIDGRPHSASVRCREACDVLAIEPTPVIECLSRHADLALRMMRALSRRLRDAHETVTAMALLAVRERVLQRIGGLAREGADGWVVPYRLKKQELAEIAGASRRMTGVAVKALVQSGALELLPDGRLRVARPHPRAAGESPGWPRLALAG